MLAVLMLLFASAALANGWEHTSIDFDVLVRALDDDNPEIRRRAAESIGFRQQDGASAALLARLQKDEAVPRVRKAIYASLGKLGTVEALPALANCLADETEIALRTTCAAALGQIDDAGAEKIALEALQDDSIEVRRHAIASLGSFNGAATVTQLVALAGDEDPRIRHGALVSLGRTGAAAAAPVLSETLRRADERDTSVAALRALTLLADAGTVEAIRGVYRGSDDPVIRSHALVAMASTRAQGSESYFLEALQSEAAASQILGLSVLRHYGTADAAAAVVAQGLRANRDLLKRSTAQIIEDAPRTINELNLLNEYLKTIIRLDPAAGEALYLRVLQPRKLPRDSSAQLKIAQGFYQARWQSLYGLGYSGSARAGEAVAAALADPDARIRAVAIRSLGVIGEDEHVARLIELLADEAAEVRWMAARVLGRLNVATATDALLARLDDAYAQVRLEAALALGYMKAEAARAKLQQLARSDSNARVSAAARHAAALID